MSFRNFYISNKIFWQERNQNLVKKYLFNLYFLKITVFEKSSRLISLKWNKTGIKMKNSERQTFIFNLSSEADTRGGAGLLHPLTYSGGRRPSPLRFRNSFSIALKGKKTKCKSGKSKKKFSSSARLFVPKSGFFVPK